MRISAESKNNIKNSIDIPQLLLKLGAEHIIDASGEIRSECVVHGGKNRTSLSYKRDSGRFKCFACNWTGDVVQLVMVVLSYSFVDAMKFLSEQTNIPLDEEEQREIHKANKKDLEFLKLGSIENLESIKVPEEISENFVKRCQMTKIHPYMASRNFHEDTIKFFEIGFCDFNEVYMNRIIIPVRDEFGKLVGYSGRAIEKEEKKKYRLKQDFHKGLTLYNLHNAISHIQKNKTLIVVEGFASVWRLYEAGIYNVVAIMGNSITDYQLELLLKHALTIILALDFDDEGVKATREAIKALKPYVDLKVLETKFEKERDLGDLSSEEVIDLFATNVVSIKTWAKDQGIIGGRLVNETKHFRI